MSIAAHKALNRSSAIDFLKVLALLQRMPSSASIFSLSEQISFDNTLDLSMILPSLLVIDNIIKPIPDIRIIGPMDVCITGIKSCTVVIYLFFLAFGGQISKIDLMDLLRTIFSLYFTK